MGTVLLVFIGLLPILLVITYLARRWVPAWQLTQSAVVGLSTINLLMALALLGLGAVWFFAPQAVQAAGLAQAVSVKDPMAYVGAGIAVGVGALGAGYAVGAVGAAAVGVIAERPDMFGRALLFVGLAEGVAIYGLLIAFIILR